MEAVCSHCSKTYQIKRYRSQITRFCSRQCAVDGKRVPKVCPACGKRFSVKRKVEKQVCCSSSCRKKYFVGVRSPLFKTSTLRPAICKVCGHEFMAKGKLLDKGFGRICSSSCRSENQSEWQRRNSPVRKEKVLVKCECCGREKLLSPAHARPFRFCSKTCRAKWQRTRMKGRNHPNWKGGHSTLRSRIAIAVEYKQWRSAVFKRDYFTCQKCGDGRGGNLQAHHIKPIATHPQAMFEIANGQTLCERCHIEHHRLKPVPVGTGRLRAWMQKQKFA